MGRLIIFSTNEENEHLKRIVQKVKKKIKKPTSMHKLQKQKKKEQSKALLHNLDIKSANINKSNLGNIIHHNYNLPPNDNSNSNNNFTEDIDINVVNFNTQYYTNENNLELPSNEQYVALDCEMVGVGPRKLSALGRCSIVDYSGVVLLDIYVQPELPITDYRTKWSGIKKYHMKKAIPFEHAQNLIKEIIKDKIIIGHSLHNDFNVLCLQQYNYKIRDTSTYIPLRIKAQMSTKGLVSLKNLTRILLGYNIQIGPHCSVEDAKAAIELYKLVQKEWELNIRTKSACLQISNDDDDSYSENFFDDKFWSENDVY